MYKKLILGMLLLFGGLGIVFGCCKGGKKTTSVSKKAGITKETESLKNISENSETTEEITENVSEDIKKQEQTTQKVSQKKSKKKEISKNSLQKSKVKSNEETSADAKTTSESSTKTTSDMKKGKKKQKKQTKDKKLKKKKQSTEEKSDKKETSKKQNRNIDSKEETVKNTQKESKEPVKSEKTEATEQKKEKTNGEQTFYGILIDEDCSNVEDPEKHDLPCMLMDSCRESGYGLDIKKSDGSYVFYMFDKKGQDLAWEYLNKTKRMSKLYVEVTGELEKGVIKVKTLVEK